MASSRPDEADLIATLAAAGVPLIQGSRGGGIVPLTDLAVRALDRDIESRVGSSLVPLFLVRPDFAGAVPQLLETLSERPARLLRYYYSAATCLQRKWETRLRIALGPKDQLPDLFGPGMGLPPADEDHGGRALAALAERTESDTDAPRGLVGETEALVLLLLAYHDRRLAREESRRVPT